MNATLLYNIPHEESFGAFIALYIFFTGLSAGSFFLSTLSYGFGQVQYRDVSRPAIVTATLMLVVAPIFLLVHVGQPLRSWHLFLYLNPASPITWGSFLLVLYPINCIIYGYFMFKENMKLTRIFGLIGIPCCIGSWVYRIHPGFRQGKSTLEYSPYAHTLPRLSRYLGYCPHDTYFHH